MARGRDTIKTRIALDGGKEFQAELEALGATGEKVWRQLQQEAEKFKGPDESVTRRLRDIAKECEKVGAAFRSMGDKVRGVGQTMSAALTLPVAGAGAGILKVAANFESAMTELKVSTGAVGDEFTALRDKAREIGKSTVFGPTQAAQAMNELAKTGTSTKDILDGAADATVRLATANGAELAPAAKLVSDALNQFNLKAKDTDKVVQLVSGAVNQSKLDFADYQNAIGQSGAVAGALGLSFEDLNIALAGTSSSFSSGADAGTSFKTFLQRLKPSTDETVQMAKEMGLNFYTLSGRMKPLSSIADELRNKFSRMSDEDRNEKMTKFFGSDGIRTALALMALGSEGVFKLQKAIRGFDTIGAANARMDGFNGQLEQLKGAFEELAIVIGDSGLLKFATDFVHAIAEIVDELAKANPEMLKWGTVIAGVVAALGPVVASIGLMVVGFGALVTAGGAAMTAIASIGTVLGTVGTAIAAVLTGIVSFKALFVAAFVAGFAAVYFFWDDIKAAASAAWEFIVGLFSAETLASAWSSVEKGAKAVWDAVVSIFETSRDTVVSVFDSLVDGIGAGWDAMVEYAKGIVASIIEPFKGAGDQIAGVFSGITDSIRSALDDAVDFVRSAADRMIDSLQAVWDAIRGVRSAASSAGSGGGGGAPGFAGGGAVHGRGTGTSDSILAWLSNGEFVIKEKAVRFYSPDFLDAINNMRLPKNWLRGFSKGGMVSIPQLKSGLPAFASGGLVDGLGAALAGLMPSMGSIPALAAPAGSGGPALQPINLSIGGREFGTVLAPADVASGLVQFAQGQQIRSAGKKPGWY
ncbi:hypothetical protein AA309_26565 [Microvirga vignae]|uniref:Phage tail tape measure protein domain-containing protein n=1 Tax=Microvirga vignae TaxID=1225564 RepID=A0A0H1RCJ1_9HYPH|nr:phage tail tape measure protein [Microvirga vignae]KLK90297.1 hypothetical protein AA309_26565 [Microvirga vignae]